MNLTPLQRRQLLSMRRMRLDAPGIAQLFASGWRGYLVMGAAAALTLVSAFYLQLAWPAALVAGVVIGAVMRDFTWLRATIAGWPLTCSLLDWEKVDALLVQDDPAISN